MSKFSVDLNAAHCPVSGPIIKEERYEDIQSFVHNGAVHIHGGYDGHKYRTADDLRSSVNSFRTFCAHAPRPASWKQGQKTLK